MSTEFGLPTRNVTQDANAGIIDPPSERTQARSQNLKKVKTETALDIGVKELGKSLGSVLAEKLTEEKAHINEQRQLEARVRQGTAHGINETDKVKKRTGWEKFVYGENVEYRAAQQQAATNAIQAKYLEEAVKIDEFAGESTETYKERLKKRLNEELDKYAGDKETQNLVSAAWQAASAKLAAKQYQAHYAYNQMQQAEMSRVMIRQTLDQLNIEAGLASSPEEAKAIENAQLDMFKGSLKRFGQDDESYKINLNGEVNNSLKNGNIRAFKAAQKSGWDDLLRPTEQAARDKAVSAYDTDYGQNIGTILADGELQAVEAQSMEDVGAAYDVIDNRLDEMEARLSGTERGDKILADARLRSARGRKSALLQGAKAKRKADDVQAAIDTWRAGDAIEVGSAQADLGLTGKDREESFDAYIMQEIQNRTGLTDLAIGDVAGKIFEKPALAKWVADTARMNNVDSPMVKSVAEQFIGGYKTLFDPENNTPTPRAVGALAAIGQFAKDAKFRGNIGKENYDNYLLIRRGITLGHTSDMIEQDIKLFEEGKGKLDIWKSKWPLGVKDERISNQQYVNNIVQGITSRSVAPQSTAQYMEDYEHGLIINKGDHRAAKRYLQTSVKAQQANLYGKAVWNGKHLDNISQEYNFEQLMDTAQEKNLLSAFIGIGLGDTRGKDAPPITKLSELKAGWNMYVEDGIEGVFLTSPEFKSPVLIPQEHLRQWGQVKEVLRLRREAANLELDKAFAKKFEEEKEQEEILAARGLGNF